MKVILTPIYFNQYSCENSSSSSFFQAENGSSLLKKNAKSTKISKIVMKYFENFVEELKLTDTEYLVAFSRDGRRKIEHFEIRIMFLLLLGPPRIVI